MTEQLIEQQYLSRTSQQKIFYDPTYMYDDAPSSAWCKILSLSSPGKWDFPKIHAFALKRLNNLFLPLVERIVLYKSCSVPFEHLLPLYAELCTREEALSLEESVRLGWELVVPILQVRECLLKWEGKGSVTDSTLHNMRAAIQGVSSTWIQDRIKSMFNAIQDVSSLTTTRGHNCPQHHEIKSNLCKAKTKARARSTSRADPCLSDWNPIKVKADPPKAKIQEALTEDSEDGWQEEVPSCLRCINIG